MDYNLSGVLMATIVGVLALGMMVAGWAGVACLLEKTPDQSSDEDLVEL
jgi:hypothetical protein